MRSDRGERRAGSGDGPAGENPGVGGDGISSSVSSVSFSSQQTAVGRKTRPGHHPAASFSWSPWAGGLFSELAVYPPGANFTNDKILARISTATIVKSGEFSGRPGLWRILMLLSKDGVELTIKEPGEPRICSLRKPFDTAEFDGGATTLSRLLGREARDFNLMLGNGADGKLFGYTVGCDRTTIMLPGTLAESPRLHGVTVMRMIDAFWSAGGVVIGETSSSTEIFQLASGDLYLFEHPGPGVDEMNLQVRSDGAGSSLVHARIWLPGWE